LEVSVEENWRPIPDRDGYFVSDRGALRGKRGILKGSTDKDGYAVLTPQNPSHKRTLKIHRLVYEAFVGPIGEDLCINHKNGIKNDNRVENLEAVSISENVLHSFRALGRRGRNTNPLKGEQHHQAKFSSSDVLTMRRLFADGRSIKDIASSYDATPSLVRRIVNRKLWSHLS
jgi:hypothetical protein